MLICMDCYNKYDKERLIKVNGYFKCPNVSCHGSDPLVECDDLIADTIIELNRKGYPTQFCCSGHIKNEGHNMKTLYILFIDLIKGNSLFSRKDIENLIDLGFDYELSDRTFIYKDGKEYVADYIKYPIKENNIQYDFLVSDSLGKFNISFNYVYEGNVKLYEWALSLPDKGINKKC